MPLCNDTVKIQRNIILLVNLIGNNFLYYYPNRKSEASHYMRILLYP